ncbi:MAG: hypothetical protein QOF90_1665 [Acetobacteraceae bacterium]|nr:hypothetical protein [Acetobacteraceae bacterium]
MQADDIERIAIGCSQMTFVHTVWPYKPASVTAAQMNLSCGLAVIALYRDASVNQDAVQLLAAPAVLGFIERICAHKASCRPAGAARRMRRPAPKSFASLPPTCAAYRPMKPR